MGKHSDFWIRGWIQRKMALWKHVVIGRETEWPPFFPCRYEMCHPCTVFWLNFRQVLMCKSENNNINYILFFSFHIQAQPEVCTYSEQLSNLIHLFLIKMLATSRTDPLVFSAQSFCSPQKKDLSLDYAQSRVFFQQESAGASSLALGFLYMKANCIPFGWPFRPEPLNLCTTENKHYSTDQEQTHLITTPCFLL